MEKLSPMITIDYQEYLKLLQEKQDMINLIVEIASTTKDEETREKATNYMTGSGRWV